MDSYDGDGMFSFPTARWRYDDKISAYGCENRLNTWPTRAYPLSSGHFHAESANKLVVEARLKGAGMHWSRAIVNPLLALRNAVCNHRWAEAWQQSVAHIRRCGLCRREVQPRSEAAKQQLIAPVAVAPTVPVTDPPDPLIARKPSADHPWRQKNDATKAAIAQTATDARK